MIINEREFPVGPGDCYFILPGSTVTYTTHPQTPREGVWCSVDGLAVGQALHHAGISEKNPFAPRALFPQLAEQIQKLARVFRRETGQAPKSYKTEKTALQAAPLFSERRKEK